MADNDVAKLIMEIEALRAELRAALGNKQGQLVQTGNTSPAANSAVQALGLHSLTANGFVSNLTGSAASSVNGFKVAESTHGIINAQTIGSKIPKGAIGSVLLSDLKGLVSPSGFVQGLENRMLEGPAISPDLRNTLASSFERNQLKNTLKLDEYRQPNARSFGPPSYLYDIDRMQKSNMVNKMSDAWNKIASSPTGNRLMNRMWNKYSRGGTIMGLGVSAFGSIKSIEREFNSEGREQFLTQAEIRSGMTHEERFGKDYSLSDHVMGAIGSAAVNAGQWAAMGMAINAMQDPKTFAKSRMYMAGAQGAMSLQNQSNRMPGTAFYRFGKGVGAAAMGLARGFAPAAALLTAVKLGEMIFSSDSDWNTWIKKSEQSNKKLKDQMDELHSIDKFTSEQQIESQLVKRGMSRSTASTAWRGGLSALGIVENPAEREGRLRAEISEDLSQASKAGAEALVEARLGNISKSEKMISEARLQAGDLVPAYWQDPLRVYTLQETASRSKACFARYLNNRTTNRSGD